MRTRLIRPVVAAAAVVLSLSFISCEKREAAEPAGGPPEITLVIHGGAGTISRDKMTPEDQQKYDELTASIEGDRTTLQEARQKLADTLKELRTLVDKYLDLDETGTD